MIVHNDIEQGSEQWFALRAGVPTASEFKKIITSSGDPSKQLGEYAAQLAGELYAGKQLDRWEGNGYTERGKELEAQARAAYEFVLDRDVTTVGFVTNHGAGCSPDGLTEDGLVEIKCLAAKNHVQTLAYFNKHAKCPTDYVPQARGQMLICDRAWVDMFFYHPDLPQLRIRVDRDPSFDAALLDQIGAAIAERDLLVSIIGRYA